MYRILNIRGGKVLMLFYFASKDLRFHDFYPPPDVTIVKTKGLIELVWTDRILVSFHDVIEVTCLMKYG